MQTNLKSVLAVGAVVGLICVAAYPIVVASGHGRWVCTGSPCLRPFACALALLAQLQIAQLQRPRIPFPCLPIKQVPLKDRSTREAPAGGFAKGAPQLPAWGPRWLRLLVCGRAAAAGAQCICRPFKVWRTNRNCNCHHLLVRLPGAGSMWKSIDAAAKAKEQQ